MSDEIEDTTAFFRRLNGIDKLEEEIEKLKQEIYFLRQYIPYSYNSNHYQMQQQMTQQAYQYLSNYNMQNPLGQQTNNQQSLLQKIFGK